jgi:hypothetical protein
MKYKWKGCLALLYYMERILCFDLDHLELICIVLSFNKLC